MSQTKSLVIHTIETLRVYPRAHYFQRRYHDLVPRFKRLTGAFPKSFQIEKSLLEIEDLDDRFTKKIDVHVLGGNGLDLSDIVVTTKPPELEKISELKEPQGTCLFICYSKTKKLDQIGLKEISDVIKTFFDDFEQENPHLVENLFVVVDTNHNHTDEERESFRRDVHEIIREKIQDTDEQTYENRIILGSPGTVLGSKIQELLEVLLVDGFHKIMDYVDRFVQKTKQNETEVDIIISDFVVKVIQAFLRDDIGLADMRQIAENDDSKKLEGMSVDEKFLVQLLKKLARLVKCAIVDPCSTKYNIPPWVVNLLLKEINFEHKLADSVSKNTKHHLRKLNEVCKDYEAVLQTHKRKAYMGRGKHGASRHEHFIRSSTNRFDFIVNDFSKVISDAEKTMASASQNITVMGKMMFEIEGYLKQTITEKFSPHTQRHDVLKKLRDAILELEDVFAIKTANGTLEVHVQNETSRVKKYVSTLMRNYGYTCPFRVKAISKEPVKKKADIQHDNGRLINKTKIEAEKTMVSASRLITSNENVLSEKEGYLEQTMTEKFEPKIQKPDEPTDQRNAILELFHHHEKQFQDACVQYDQNDLDFNHRVPTDIEISRMAPKIGKEYFQLGIEMGLSEVELSHIETDHRDNAVRRNMEIIFKWRQNKNDNATYGDLRKALIRVNKTPDNLFNCI